MDFDLIKHLLSLTVFGTEWVLWLLMALSVLSVTVMVERLIFFVRIRLNYIKFSDRLTAKLIENDIEGVKKICYETPSLESQVVLKAYESFEKGPVAMDHRMAGFISAERHSLDRGLVILATLGSNAPFIGLFGTVLGIIKAFADLASNPAGGPSVVMSGISEALIATAVGLMVAIPAVIAYNLFTRTVKRKIANAQSLREILVAHYS